MMELAGGRGEENGVKQIRKWLLTILIAGRGREREKGGQREEKKKKTYLISIIMRTSEQCQHQQKCICHKGREMKRPQNDQDANTDKSSI